MSERYNYYFDQYDGDSFIYDVKTGNKIEYLSTCADILNQQHQKIAELEQRLSNCVELPCIQKRTIYPDINSMRTKEEWYVVFRKKGYTNQIFTIRCGSELSAKKELEELQGANNKS